MSKSYTLFPIITSGKSIVRYFSSMNPWVDFVVLVDSEKLDMAKSIVKRSMDEYWNSDSEAYGDVVERALNAEGIDYTIIYHDSFEESDEYETIWNAYLDAVYKQTTTSTTLGIY